MIEPGASSFRSGRLSLAALPNALGITLAPSSSVHAIDYDAAAVRRSKQHNTIVETFPGIKGIAAEPMHEQDASFRGETAANELSRRFVNRCDREMIGRILNLDGHASGLRT